MQPAKRLYQAHQAGLTALLLAQGYPTADLQSSPTPLQRQLQDGKGQSTKEKLECMSYSLYDKLQDYTQSLECLLCKNNMVVLE